MSWSVAIALIALPGVALAQSGLEVQSAAPQGEAPTRATFISTSSRQWDVVVDDQPVCSTPCSGPLFPLQFVMLRSQEESPVRLDVGRLPPGDVMVSGKPLQHGKYAGGIVATTLGGMAMAIGITFTAVGLAKDSDGMTTAGLITGAAGAVAIPGGIYLMMSAVPSVTVGTTPPHVSGTMVGLAGAL